MISAPVSIRAISSTRARRSKAFDVYFGPPADGFLFYQQVAIGKAGNLRLVRHAKNLIGLRQLLELGADCFADATPMPESISSNTMVRGNSKRWPRS